MEETMKKIEKLEKEKERLTKKLEVTRKELSDLKIKIQIIEALNLSDRTYYILRYAGYSIVQQLADAKVGDLKKIPDMHVENLDEILLRLFENGIILE